MWLGSLFAFLSLSHPLSDNARAAVELLRDEKRPLSLTGRNNIFERFFVIFNSSALIVIRSSPLWHIFGEGREIKRKREEKCSHATVNICADFFLLSLSLPGVCAFIFVGGSQEGIYALLEQRENIEGPHCDHTECDSKYGRAPQITTLHAEYLFHIFRWRGTWKYYFFCIHLHIFFPLDLGRSTGKQKYARSEKRRQFPISGADPER